MYNVSFFGPFFCYPPFDQDMYSACDVEGHKGKDGRYYLLDFARSFPPESPHKVRPIGV